MTRRLVIATACMLLSVHAGAQPSVDALARDVERAEAVRTVKTLQRTYAQYSQYGLWNEMAALFADDARLTIGDDVVTGRGAIAALPGEPAGNRALERALLPPCFVNSLTPKCPGVVAGDRIGRFSPPLRFKYA